MKMADKVNTGDWTLGATLLINFFLLSCTFLVLLSMSDIIGGRTVELPTCSKAEARYSGVSMLLIFCNFSSSSIFFNHFSVFNLTEEFLWIVELMREFLKCLFWIQYMPNLSWYSKCVSGFYSLN
jgi:hypothetical protein